MLKITGRMLKERLKESWKNAENAGKKAERTLQEHCKSTSKIMQDYPKNIIAEETLIYKTQNNLD